MIVADVHRFVRQHPACDYVFPGWSHDQLMWHLAESMRDGDLYVAAADDRIYGVIIANVNHETREIRVSSILTQDPQAFIKFVRKWAAMYPDYTVVGRRTDTLRRFTLRNFKRFLHNEQRTNSVPC